MTDASGREIKFIGGESIKTLKMKRSGMAQREPTAENVIKTIPKFCQPDFFYSQAATDLEGYWQSNTTMRREKQVGMHPHKARDA